MLILPNRRKAHRALPLILDLDATVGVKEGDGSDAESGDIVTDWEDQSGNGNDVTCTSGYTFQTSPADHIDVVNYANEMTLGTIWSTDELAAFFVIKLANASSVLVAEGGYLEAQFACSWGSAADAEIDCVADYWVDGTAVTSDPTGTELYNAMNTGDFIVLSVNVTSGMNNFAAGKLFGSDSGVDFLGDIKRVLMYDRVLTQSEREGIEDDLGSEYSITITR